MKRFIFQLVRLAAVISLLFGAVQPTAIAYAQPIALTKVSAGAQALAPELAEPVTPYGTVWPGKITPGYQYSRSFGESGKPYPPDGQEAYLNQPAGLVLDADGRLFTVEGNGHRLFGLNTKEAGGAPLAEGTLLQWAPYGQAGVRDKLNNPQQLWADPDDDYLWVTNWNYISIFDRSSGELLWNLSDFDSNNLFRENRLDCLQGIAVDKSSTPWQLMVSENCNKDHVLVFELANQYSDTTTLKLQKVLTLNRNMGFNNPRDLQFVDRTVIPGPIDKRLIVAHNNGLSEFANDSNDPAGWEMSQQINLNGGNSRGLALDPENSQFVYVTGNFNDGPAILKVNTDASNDWVQYIPGWDQPTETRNFNDPQDLAFDEAGNLYLSDGSDMVIHNFTSTLVKSRFYGTPGIPYSTPLTPQNGYYYYNTPAGLAVDANDNFYVLENRGQRLTKLAANGDYLWSFGLPGTSAGREATDLLNWPQGNPAVTADGTVYLPDWNNQRVILLDQNGAYMGTMGNQPDEIYRFNCPAGVSIGPNGDIYVVDQCNNNIQVYDANRIYRSSIGFKGLSGSDNTHFNNPAAIAVRDANTVLVADRGNNRVQACQRTQNGGNEAWSCQTVAGVTGEDSNNHPGFLSNLSAIAWDTINQLMLVGDQSGVLMYDQAYQLVGTLGDRQVNSSQPGMFSNISALAVDSGGNLYTADWNTMRVDRFVLANNPLELAGVNGGMIHEIGLAEVPEQGSYLVTGMGGRLAAFDLTNPASPAFAGASALLPNNFKHLSAQGAYAYALTNDDYLRIFSLTDPTHPAQVSSMAIIGAQGLSVENDWLFAVSCCAGGNAWQGPRLLAINIDNPAKPAVEQTQILDMQSNPQWYANQIVTRSVNNTIEIYIALQHAGIEKYIFNLADKTFSGPAKYTATSSTNKPLVFNQLALNTDGTRLYALGFPDWDESDGYLHAIETEPFTIDPNEDVVPTTLGNVRMMLKADHLYLPGRQVMEVYDTTNLQLEPIIVRSNQPELSYETLLETNNALYSASGGLGLLTISLTLTASDETQRSTLVSRLRSPSGFPGLISANSGVVFGAQWDMGVSRFTTADPGRPVETHQVTNLGINRVALETVAGHLYAFSLAGYQSSQDKLVVLDGDDPGIQLADSVSDNPSDQEGYFTNNGTNLVVLPGAVNEALVYIAGVNNGIRAYAVDFNDVDNVVITYISDTNLGLDSFWNMNMVALIDTYLLIPNQNSGVKVVDLSDADSLTVVAEITGRPVTVAALDRKAYIVTDDNILHVYEPTVTGLGQLTGFAELGTLNWPGQFGWPNQINLKSYGGVTYAYIVTGSHLLVLNVTDPANMTIVAVQNGRAGWINTGVTLGNFFLVSQTGMGLYTYWAPPATQETLSQVADLLDSSAVDGVQIHFNAPITPVTLLHMPVYTGNVSGTFPTGLQGIGHTFEIFARDAATDRPITDLGETTYTLSVAYLESEIAGLNEHSLALYYWNGSAWIKDYTSEVNSGLNTISGTPNHFSLWTVAGMADEAASGGVLTINNGAEFTQTTPVTLTLTDLSADADRVRFQDCSTCLWSTWQDAFAPNFSFTLSGGDGPKSITAQIIDNANNLSQVQDAIVLDTTPPGGSITINETGPTKQNPVHLNLSGISDALSGLDQMLISEDPDFAGASWQLYADALPFTLANANGTSTLYARFRDLAGNVTTAEMKAAITLDTTAPSGALTIIGMGEPTVTHAVSLVLTAADNLSGASTMRVSEDPAFGGVSWVAYTAITPFILSTVDGLKTVYAQVQDGAGNISSVEIKDSITLDTSAPTGRVSINHKPYTTTAEVTLALTGAGAATMRLANSSAGLDAASWQPFAASMAWTLTQTDGVKTVYVEYKDGSGIRSPVYSDTTILDTTAPSGTLYINGGVSLTAAQSVSLFLTVTESGSGVSQVRVSSSSAMTGAAWAAFTNPSTFSLPVGDGQKTVYIQLKDNAGNVSTVISDTITLDITAPDGSLSISGDNQIYTSHQVILTLSAADAISQAANLQMQVSNDSVFSGASWQPYQTELFWTLNPGCGNQMVYARFRDGAGNISTYNATIIVKTYIFLPAIVRR